MHDGIRGTLILILLACSVLANAQEVKSIDLTAGQSRGEVEPRREPPPGANCKFEYGSGEPAADDSHAVGVYLLRVSPTEIDSAKPFEAYFRIVNTGLAPIEIPVAARLSDLQPDGSVEFSYLGFRLFVQARPEPGPVGWLDQGSVDLFGSPDHAGSIVVLRPGEWISLKSTIKLRTSPPQSIPIQLSTQFWLRKATFHPRADGACTDIRNIYPHVTETPSIPAHFVTSGTPRQTEQ